MRPYEEVAQLERIFDDAHRGDICSGVPTVLGFGGKDLITTELLALSRVEGFEASFAHRVQDITSRVLERTVLPMSSPLPGFFASIIQARVEMLEAATRDLCVFAALGMQSNPLRVGTIKLALERLASPRRDHLLERYPALLLLYTAGVAGVLAKDGSAVRELLLNSRFLNSYEPFDIALGFDVEDVTNAFWGIPPHGQGGPEIPLPWHEHLKDWVRSIFRVLDNQKQDAVDAAVHVFEFLRLLIQLDLDKSPLLRPGSFIYNDRAGENICAFLDELSAGGHGWVYALFDNKPVRLHRAVLRFDHANALGTLSRNDAYTVTIPLNLAARVPALEPVPALAATLVGFEIGTALFG